MTTTHAELEQRITRGAHTQSLFRDVNDRIEHLNEVFSTVLPLGSFVCECARAACSERVELDIEEYRALRSNAARFVVAAGKAHVFPLFEHLVERHDRYWVVEKVGLAGEVATALSATRAAVAGSPGASPTVAMVARPSGSTSCHVRADDGRHEVLLPGADQ